MNRRGFLGSLIGGVATAAAVRTWPFRVFSFPSQVEFVVLPLPDEFFVNTPLFHYMNRVHVRLENISVPTEEEIEKYA